LDFLKEKPTIKEVKEGLEAHSIEIETIEKQGSDYMLDLKVLPNRMGDMSSHFGLAREIAAVLGLPKPTLTRNIRSIKKKEAFLLELQSNQKEYARVIWAWWLKIFK